MNKDFLLDEMASGLLLPVQYLDGPGPRWNSDESDGTAEWIPKTSEDGA